MSKSGGTETGLSFDVPITPHGQERIPWQQRQRSGSREDRLLQEITVNLPPMTQEFTLELPPAIGAAADDALTAIVRLDASHGDHLTALSALLLRAESVASSKIEHLEATVEDFARASHGMRSNSSATSMVASARALHSLIASVEDNAPITLENILTAHHVLMADDPSESRYAGRVRDMQNWIGGSDHSPRGALYIPPPPQDVPAYLTDLLEFANRDDLPVLEQAAITHAQFESIHPFTDGNGRIGRALINTIFRRRGITSHVVIPLASALVSKRDTYFSALGAYREGNAGPIIRAFIRSTLTAARESEVSAQHLAALPKQWSAAYAVHSGRKLRANSAAQKVLEELPRTPFFTAEDMVERVGGSTSSIYSAIETLTEAGVLRPLTNRKRNQIWCAGAIIDELEDLGMRISDVTMHDRTWTEISDSLVTALHPLQEQIRALSFEWNSGELRQALNQFAEITREVNIPEEALQGFKELSDRIAEMLRSHNSDEPPEEEPPAEDH